MVSLDTNFNLPIIAATSNSSIRCSGSLKSLSLLLVANMSDRAEFSKFGELKETPIPMSCGDSSLLTHV